MTKWIFKLEIILPSNSKGEILHKALLPDDISGNKKALIEVNYSESYIKRIIYSNDVGTLQNLVNDLFRNFKVALGVSHLKEKYVH